LAEFPPHPPSAKPEHRIEPRHLPEALRAEHQRKMSFPFSERIGRAQIQIARDIFLWCCRAERGSGGANQLRSKKVRAKDTISPPTKKSELFSLF